MFDCPKIVQIKILMYNEHSVSSHYQIKIIKKLKDTKEERELLTICENLWHRLEYQGLELEDGTKKPHYGKPIWELALSAVAPEGQRYSYAKSF